MLLRIFANGVTGHRDLHNDTSCIDIRINFFKSLSSNRCFKVVSSLAVCKGEKTLADRITEGHSSRVNKCDTTSVAPCEQVSGNLAA